jgi:hypothetical protein
MSQPHSPQPTTPLFIGLHAARANLVPGLIVQSLMLAVVLSYYFLPAASGVLNTIAGVKAALGLLFAIVAAIFAGAIAPEVLKILCFQHGRPTRANFRTLAIATLFWGLQGILVDSMYRFLSATLGNDVTLRTIAGKVAFDQFLVNPFFIAIANTIVYDLLARGFTWPNLRSCLTWRYYKTQVFPILVAGWGVWIPVVCAVYSLPPLLQFPLFTLALTFWATMLAWMGGVQARAHAAPA